jgi:hypothetical protein
MRTCRRTWSLISCSICDLIVRIAYPAMGGSFDSSGAPVCHASRGGACTRIVTVTLTIRVSGRCACAIAGSYLLTGCAIFEPEPSARASGQQRSRVTLKDDAWTAPAFTPAKPKVAGNVRRAEPPPSPPAAPVAPTSEPGSCGNADQCALLLRRMVDDPTRSWIIQRTSPAVYANGTRLFAYLALRAKLSCAELRLALTEMQAATNFLTGRIPGYTVDQVARVRALNSRVEGELRAEHTERCKGDLATSTG